MFVREETAVTEALSTYLNVCLNLLQLLQGNVLCKPGPVVDICFCVHDSLPTSTLHC